MERSPCRPPLLSSRQKKLKKKYHICEALGRPWPSRGWCGAIRHICPTGLGFVQLQSEIFDMSLLDETVLTFPEATRALPQPGGRAIHTTTLWRWARQGLRGAGGSLVRLEYIRLGRKLFTSKEALARFAERLAAADDDAPEIPVSATGRHAAAEREAVAAGL